MNGYSLQIIWHRTYTSYWFIPMIMALIGMVFPYLLLKIELDFETGAVTQLFSWLEFTDREVAHQLLTAIISSIINVICITFSLTMVVLTLAASKYGPQVLRNFMEDTATKLVLGIFVSAFLYCLLSLRILGSISADDRVPVLIMAGAMVLTVLSVATLIYFIQHISKSIQVDIIIKRLSQELLKAVELQFPSKVGEKESNTDTVNTSLGDNNPITVKAELGGYIQSVSGDDLLVKAMKGNYVIEVIATPGKFVVPGSVLALISRTQNITDNDIKEVCDSFIIGARRTPVQDIEYSVEKISEIALRAVSPGVNEPYVAIKCINYLSLALTIMVNREQPERLRLDEEGNVRLIVEPVGFGKMLSSCFDPVIHYSGTDAGIAMTLLQAMENLILCNGKSHNESILAKYMRFLLKIIEERSWDADEKERLLDNYKMIKVQLKETEEV